MKKLIAIILTVALIISVCPLGAFTATAEEAASGIRSAPADSEADYYDVDGKGIKANLVQYPYHLKPADALGNLDFEDGYRFWAGGKDKGTYASEVFDIVTENGNSYAKIPASGYVSNFQSALFKLDGVEAGDEIVVVYDVKGADGTKLRIRAEQEFIKEIAVYDETTGLVTTTKADGVTLINASPGIPSVLVGTNLESSEFEAQLGAEGWTTLVTVSNTKFLEPQTSPAQSGTKDTILDAYFVKLTVTLGDSGVVAGDVVDAAIDNIRICKVVDGDYIDVSTNEAIIFKTGKTGDCTWYQKGGRLTISGNGKMGDYSYSSKSPWGTGITEVIIKRGVTSIGNYAFYACSALTSITIPDSVTSIGKYAFFCCTSLTSITIPDGVTSIGGSAFYGCRALSSITIPSSVTSIGDYAFYDCSALTNVYYKGSEAQHQEISIDSSNDCLLNATWHYNICMGTTEHTYDNVSDIQCNECGYCRYITYTISNGEATITDCDHAIIGKVIIPSTIEGYPVTSIGHRAFYDCSALTSITIPDGVTSIGEYAFSGCSSLTSITIPDSVTSIGSDAFRYCTSLTSITIPDSVTSIGDSAFEDCSSLTAITIPDGVTSIGDDAFYNCSSLTSITIPDGVTRIGNQAFENCTSLTSITIPDSVTSIGRWAFYNCSALTSITIPDGVTSIGDNAFNCCYKLQIVDITDLDAWSNIIFADAYANPMRYGENLYLNNQLVTEITVPDIQIIGEYQYYNIKSLKNIFLPKELVLVKQNAFYGCSGLENVYFEGTAEEWAAVTVLSGNDYLKNVSVYFNCTKIPGGLTGIEITKLPEKVQYIEKKETLDLTGGILTLYYDGATKDIDLATLIVEGFDNTKLGKQTITVKYGAYSTQFEIGIIERPKTFVAIVSLPDKNHYKFGESLDLTGGKIAVGYPDGTYEILDITADMVSGYDANDIGYQILTVTYGSFTANFIVSVINDGDLNGDGKVDLLDLVKFKKLLAGVETSTNLPLDFDGDGKTTATDMIMLMGIILAPNKK